MRLRAVILLLLTLFPLHAGKLISPDDALKQTYGEAVTVEKKGLFLTPKETKALSKSAHAKIKTNKFRTFTVKSAGKIVAYAVLIIRKVRTKSAALLYMIEPAGVIKAVEIVAFNEPAEFIPPTAWISQFNGKSSADPLRLNKDIPNITGATMTTRVITQGSRIALAIFHTMLR